MNTFKKLIAAATLTAAFSGMHSIAASAEAYFVGKVIFTTSTGTCEWNPVGSRRSARFAPAGVSNNGSDTRLSLFDDWNAIGMTLTNGSFASTFKAVTAYEVWAGAGDAGVVKVRVSNQKPASIAATTDNVELQGQIKGGIAGPDCVLTYRMNLVRSAP